MRAHSRRDVQSPGVIFYEPGYNSIDCVILNISVGGARVRLPRDVDLPTAVQLFVGPGCYLKALVRWRIGLDAGLAFVG
jgi:hypothetical protein